MKRNIVIYALTLALVALIADVYAMIVLGQGLGRFIQGVVQSTLLFLTGFGFCLVGYKRSKNESSLKSFILSGVYTWAMFSVVFKLLYNGSLHWAIVFFGSMSVVAFFSYVIGVNAGIKGFFDQFKAKKTG